MSDVWIPWEWIEILLNVLLTMVFVAAWIFVFLFALGIIVKIIRWVFEI
jgi:hypothetical protein